MRPCIKLLVARCLTSSNKLLVVRHLATSRSSSYVLLVVNDDTKYIDYIYIYVSNCFTMLHIACKGAMIEKALECVFVLYGNHVCCTFTTLNHPCIKISF